jgi:hypothetical protein
MRILALGTLATLAVAVERVPPQRAPADVVYVAELQAINVQASMTRATGTVRFTVRGDSLTIRVQMHDVPAGIEHWQHFHGFPDGHQSVCPTASSDTSGDGLVDIRETEHSAGTTMVPFNVDPVAMDIPTHTYPQANGTGTYDYTKTVSVAALQRAFGARYTGGTLDLSRRVAMVHGVPESTTLPSTVASLGPIPARVTLPIACGPIRRLQ